MMGVSVVLLVAVALIAMFATHTPTAKGVSDVGARVREHLFGPTQTGEDTTTPTEGDTTTSSPNEEIDDFDYTIYRIDE